MHKWIMAIVVSPFPMAVIACNAPEPVCATEAYMQAHIDKDPNTLFELTADSQRGDKHQFLADYHYEHVVPKVFQGYWEERASFEASLIDETEDFARVWVVSHYPDWAGVAIKRADEQGAVLNTREDWESLVDTLLSQDVAEIRAETEFYLVRSDSEWRILRPTLH